MIIVKLFGGLGNQLFQYAAGRSLAVRRKTGLYLDVDSFQETVSGVTTRQFELRHFQIDAPVSTAPVVKKVLSPSLPRRITRKLFPRPGNGYYKERFYQFDPQFAGIGIPVILDGYWQSQRYFKDAEAVIRKDLSIRSPLSPTTVELAKRIGKAGSASLHVRRGDYVSNPETFQYHGICGLDYYRAALETLPSRAQIDEIFVFSDDIQWASQNLRSALPLIFVDHDRHAYEDLYLMSRCRHNIIANSSFSWWGAWLNENPDKVVIAPARWFNDPAIDTSDLLPPEWIKL